MRRQRELLRARVSEQKKAILEEQKRSEELLLNILPAAIAKELKTTGKNQPTFFEEVSILFADFKGFTNIVASITGKINVSAYTADLVQNQFPCTYRGKINAKGKGELDMYFVE